MIALLVFLAITVGFAAVLVAAQIMCRGNTAYVAVDPRYNAYDTMALPMYSNLFAEEVMVDTLILDEVVQEEIYQQEVLDNSFDNSDY